jgi:hypothetical protein
MFGRLRTLRVCFATACTSPAPQFIEVIPELPMQKLLHIQKRYKAGLRSGVPAYIFTTFSILQGDEHVRN